MERNNERLPEEYDPREDSLRMQNHYVISHPSNKDYDWDFITQKNSFQERRILLDPFKTSKIPRPTLLSLPFKEKSPNVEYFTTYGCQTLEQVLRWNEIPNDREKRNELMKNIVIPLRPRAKRIGPKVILCHDYKYNYCERNVDDRMANHHLSEEMQFYTFQYWSLIDIFIYFTHKLLTIPPPEWIQACHQNGVACFGTLMIEHWTKYKIANDQTEINGELFLDQLLSNAQLTNQFLNAMSNIQDLYKFDGWLINIESPIKPNNIARMEYFLQTLKNRISKFCYNEMSLIWYDSVIKTGQLQFQNELNELNDNFFSCTDGIFLNYTWNDENLIKSHQFAQEHRKPYDVFVGVDCYGRGCFAGGGLETYQAIKKILQHDLSIAIFAPGWTYESKLTENPTIITGKTHCYNVGYSLDDEYRFWSKIAIDGGLLKCENTLSSLPLYTCFNIGYGHDYHLLGQTFPPNATNRRWLNFEKNQLQPSFFKPNQLQNDDYKISITFDCPFNGGTSFQIDMYTWHILKPITLFRTRIMIDLDQASIFRYQIVYKYRKPESSLGLNQWINANLRTRTMIDYKEFDENEECDLTIVCRKIRKNPKVKRLILDKSGWFIEKEKNRFNGIIDGNREAFLHYETFQINTWRTEQMVLNLDPTYFSNKSLILLAFRIEPYFHDNENNLFLNQISKKNPLIVHIGEFYFDHYDPNIDHFLN